MTPDVEVTSAVPVELATSAGDIVELLDVLWERTRDRGWASPASLAQLRLMYAVDREDGIRMRALGVALNVSAPSLNAALRPPADGGLRRAQTQSGQQA